MLRWALRLCCLARASFLWHEFELSDFLEVSEVVDSWLWEDYAANTIDRPCALRKQQGMSLPQIIQVPQLGTSDHAVLPSTKTWLRPGRDPLKASRLLVFVLAGMRLCGIILI